MPDASRARHPDVTKNVLKKVFYPVTCRLHVSYIYYQPTGEITPFAGYLERHSTHPSLHPSRPELGKVSLKPRLRRTSATSLGSRSQMEASSLQISSEERTIVPSVALRGGVAGDKAVGLEISLENAFCEVKSRFCFHLFSGRDIALTKSVYHSCTPFLLSPSRTM